MEQNLQKNYANLTDITIREYKTIFLPKNFLSQKIAECIWHNYSSYLNIDFPSAKTGNKWKLTARGWVGYLAISDNKNITIEPKVSVKQFFQMIECAFDIRVKTFTQLSKCASIHAFYNFLAKILIEKIRRIKHLGLTRSVTEKQEWLPHVRGKIQLRESWKKRHQFFVHFDEHSVNNFDNQVLIATLRVILYNTRCFEQLQQQARETYYWLCKHVSSSLIPQQELLARLQRGNHYNRLNAHYKPIHALCRFFLSHTAPLKSKGDHPVTSFLVNMPYLYEKFVANWLGNNLKGSFRLTTKEKITFCEKHFSFVIDMVLYKNNQPFCVIDTKYKNVTKPPHADIFQIISYAKLRKCSQAILIYPCALEHKLDQKIGNIRVRSLSFMLDNDLQTTGNKFLRDLL
ncbi:McrC family protein [Candidatus Uabimicrobium amorphum]|uniref:IQ calmodulin-binding-domain protein n=1 Tax=Uabimicrobium amorphum TaxID=2596890 RepID=A0A5S9IPQ9_UABAM|nr:hypothetical protein [Candidatus Uabimicrobium amorphum]BBM84890.1 IQ calmodulin-binding- domain protein [Candidatus Uabimicrobium amorphum]